MSKRIGLLFMLVTFSTFTSGCVRQLITVKTQPEGAKVYFYNEYKGDSPTSFEFLHYGTYRIRLEKEGYKRKEVIEEIKGPWFLHTPIDFFVAFLLPFKIVDKHNFNYTLQKKEKAKEPEE